MASLTPRQIIDPNNTLPLVSLTKSRPQDCFGDILVRYYRVFEGEILAGDIVLTTRTEQGEAFFGDIHVTNDRLGMNGIERQHRGVGRATYLAAIEMAHSESLTFRTGFNISESARKVWDDLVGLGIAQVVEPFTSGVYDRSSGVKVYQGHVQIVPSTF